MKNTLILTCMENETLEVMQRSLQGRVKHLPDSPLIGDYREMLSEINAEIEIRAQMSARVAQAQS